MHWSHLSKTIRAVQTNSIHKASATESTLQNISKYSSRTLNISNGNFT